MSGSVAVVGLGRVGLPLAHLPSFPVDVQRRWPSVEKAKRLLGWEAEIDVSDGLAATVRWLRERKELVA